LFGGFFLPSLGYLSKRKDGVFISVFYSLQGRSKCSRGLRRGSAVAWLLGSRVRIPIGVRMFASCVCMLCWPV
jgi:hypothetical protein